MFFIVSLFLKRFLCASLAVFTSSVVTTVIRNLTLWYLIQYTTPVELLRHIKVNQNIFLLVSSSDADFNHNGSQHQLLTWQISKNHAKIVLIHFLPLLEIDRTRSDGSHDRACNYIQPELPRPFVSSISEVFFFITISYDTTGYCFCCPFTVGDPF